MPNEQKEKISESQEVALVAPGMDVAILDDLGFAQLYDEERLTESVDQNERVESDQACIKQ